MKGVLIISEIKRPDLKIKEKEPFHGCEKTPLICCTPKIKCADIAVKVKKVEHKNLCRLNETVFCYKVCNYGPGTASNIILMSFICPAPAKVCIKENKKLIHFTYKNGIFKACIDHLKPCECFEFELIIRECEIHQEKCEKKFYDCNFGCETKKPPKRYETTTVVEAQEEDLNICNNVCFTSSKDC